MSGDLKQHINFLDNKIHLLELALEQAGKESGYLWGRLFAVYKEHGGILDLSTFKERELHELGRHV